MKLFFSILITCLGLELTAQVKGFESDYTPLTSKGDLPDIFIKSATAKANQDLSKLNKERGVKNRYDREEFLLKANFVQDKLLRSGRILFNDDISTFVNKVADEALKQNPTLRNELQILIVKSKIANAYSFDNGLVLVTTGLIAQLDNESQLAFILCHEAMHYKKKHSVEAFVTASKYRSRWSRDVDFDEYKYSQEHELEADVEGSLEFKKSNYSYKGITGAFNVLKYSHLPFDELKYNKSFLEDSNFVFPSDYQLKEVSPIKSDEDYDDSKSTHPNIKKRKEAVNNKLGDISETGRQKFLVNQDEFYKVREMARFEQCRIELMNEDFSACVYNCYLLLQKYPENVFLKTTLGKALFQVAANKTSTNSDYLKILKPEILKESNNRRSISYDDIVGNSQQLYYLFNKLNSTQSCALALNYNWKLRNSLKDGNKTVNKLCDSLFVLLALNNETALSYFKSESRKDYIENLKNKLSENVGGSVKEIPVKKDTVKKTSILDLDANESDSKVKHIETEKDKKELEVLTKVNKDSIQNATLEADFDKFAFSEFMNDTLFVNKYKKAYKLIDEVSKKKKEALESENTTNVGGIGVDKIVILSPFYSQIDNRWGQDEIQHIPSEKKLVEFTGILKENAALVGLQYDFINSRGLGKADINIYNDFSIINEWIGEYINHNFNSNMLVLNNDAATLLKNKYKTKYVLWSGVVNVRIKKTGIGSAFLGTFLVYPAVFTIPHMFTKTSQTVYISALFNLEDNKIQFYQTTAQKNNDNKDFLNSWVYDSMLNIKSEPKFK